MEINNPITLHPLMQKIIDRLVKTGAGEVIVTEDGHVFFQPSVYIEHLWGAADMKREGWEAGVHVIIRRIKRRGKRCKYAGMPAFQIYVLPIVKKNAKTMTDNERRNMELNKQALRMAHAIERDPEQAAYYHELHETHKLNPVGYKKLYPNFFGFLVATFRMQIEAMETEKEAETAEATAGTINAGNTKGIRLCVPTAQPMPRHTICMHAFRPFIRLPMVA